MNEIARCDWLPERARWSYLGRSGVPAVTREKNFSESQIIYPLLTKLFRSKRLDIGLVLFWRVYNVWTSTPSLSINTQKKELGQHPAILTSRLVNEGYSWMVFQMQIPLIKITICLVPQAGKMNQIARCDWLPERARWSHLARSGPPAVSRKQNFPKSHMINPLLTKFVRSRWLDTGLVLFFCLGP